MNAPPRHPWRSSLALALASFVTSVLVVETAFRALGFDFAFRARAFEKLPIFYRQPVVSVGSVFFRRPGPARWEGQVLTPGMERVGVAPELRPAEPEVSISYDELGFRNPEDLRDWKAASARHAVLAFFEGNDLQDLQREARGLAEAQRRGFPPTVRSPLLERIQPQSSFLRASWELLARERRRPPSHVGNAFFVHGGTSTPVTLSYAPPGAEDLGPRMRALLESALQDWADAARSLGMRAWLLYLPCKERVLHGRLRFRREAPPKLAGWTPTDLPELVGTLAARHGIGFVDPTPELEAEVAEGRLPFNGIWDTHLDRLGCRVVARVLAAALAPELAEPAQ
jgi:hypothetical protein